MEVERLDREKSSLEMRYAMANYLNTNYPYLQYNETRNGKVFVDKTLMISIRKDTLHINISA